MIYAVAVQKKRKPQVLWPSEEGLLRAKQKLELGFREFFLFVNFFWRSERKVKYL